MSCPIVSWHSVALRAVVVIVGASAAALGCSDAQNSLNCSQICDRYQSCFNTNYDTGSCHSRCVANADNDAGAAHQVSVCSACISGISCSSALFSCGTDCAGIVP